MISAWKRFINKSDSNHETAGGPNGVPVGVQKLDKDVQRKFARGVNYNMKVIIKGDARVGKTSLFLRLKGYGFEDNYTPTENLNVTSINWSYKTTDDIVKVDLWEAIDSNVKRSINFVDLKLENKATPQDTSTTSKTDQKTSNTVDQIPSNSTVNATTIITNTKLSLNGCTNSPIPESARRSLTEMSENFDVYRGANAVLLVFDMTKLWTFKYVQAEIVKIPKHIPILVIANHRDQGHHRTVSSEQVKSFIEGLDRTPCDAIVMYTESSMKNGFGLKLIERFFNVPFLKLQEECLLKQIELNRCEYMATLDELQIMQESTNREYEQYLELETIKRRQQADAMSPVNSGLRQLDESTRDQIRNSTISSDEIDKKVNVKSIESNNNTDKQSTAQLMASQKFVNDRLTSIVIGAKNPLPEVKNIQLKQAKPNSAIPKQEGDSETNEVEASEESDEEEVPRANPLVADYQSDLDSDDQVKSTKGVS